MPSVTACLISCCVAPNSVQNAFSSLPRCSISIKARPLSYPVPHKAMNSSPGSSVHFGAATRSGTLMGSSLASGLRTASGRIAVTFLWKRSWVASIAR